MAFDLGMNRPPADAKRPDKVQVPQRTLTSSMVDTELTVGPSSSAQPYWPILALQQRSTLPVKAHC
jgi:hypothetical protein